MAASLAVLVFSPLPRVNSAAEWKGLHEPAAR
jgi:hypothetical protein